VVEHRLPKPGVVGSNPISRSIYFLRESVLIEGLFFYFLNDARLIDDIKKALCSAQSYIKGFLGNFR
jgi:hypothetical protein